MKINKTLAAAILLAMLETGAVATAQNQTATCPVHNQPSILEKIVGSGSQRQCVYGHLTAEQDSQGNMHVGHHTFSESCPGTN